MTAPIDTSAGRGSGHAAAHDAYTWLRALFVAAPILFGLSKFTDLVDWSAYLWSGVGDALPISPGQTMMIVGVVEVVAGILVAVRPRVGALVVAAWLGVVVVNLLLVGEAYDVVARDLGLLVAALTLARLAGPFGSRTAGGRASS